MKWPAILLITVFYGLIVFFGIVLLAVAQLRSSSGATFDTWRVNYAANTLGNAILEKRVREATDKAREDAISQSMYEGWLEYFDERGLLKKEMVDEETQKEIVEARQNHTDPNKLTGLVSCAIKGGHLVKSDIAWFKRLVEDDTAQIADLKKLLTSGKKALEDLRKEHQDYLAFIGMEEFWYGPFVVAPYDLIVLLLVMFMGALGGIIRLLRDRGAAAHPNPQPSEYVFVPLIGAVVGVGGYVLAKTGLLVLSSARGETSLSPFMISMVGIVSGLLAKEVIDTISDRGRTMLSRKPSKTVRGHSSHKKQRVTRKMSRRQS